MQLRFGVRQQRSDQDIDDETQWILERVFMQRSITGYKDAVLNKIFRTGRDIEAVSFWGEETNGRVREMVGSASLCGWFSDPDEGVHCQHVAYAVVGQLYQLRRGPGLPSGVVHLGGC